MVTTKILNVELTEYQYDVLEELIEREGYISKEKFIHKLLYEKINEYSAYLHEKAKRDRDKHTPLIEYGRSKGME